MKARQAVTSILVLVGVLLGVAWLGLQVPPTAFPDFHQPSRRLESLPLPMGLPAPVERFYRATYGDRIPLVRSVVITGRARIRPLGIWLPARYRFTHDAGRGYRHYIEATWFRAPLLKVNERYIDGVAGMELPWQTDEGARLDQAANLGMWAELASAAPAVLVTDARVRWEAIDDETALLYVPLGETGSDAFVVRFDPGSGRIAMLEAMRYRDSKSAGKVLWIAANEGDRTVADTALPAVGSATWLDQGRPWAVFTAEDIRTNVDVESYLRQPGL